MELKLFIFTTVFCCLHGKKPKKQTIENEDSLEDFDADVFCKSQSRLLKIEKSDEIILVDTDKGSSILLECKYCEEKDNGLPKTWNRQKHIFTGNITEVETSMDNDPNTSSIFVTRQHSLVMRDLQESDLGLYFCKAPYMNSIEKSFNYLVDFVNKTDHESKGKIDDFKNYTQIYIAAANNLLANLTFLEDTSTHLKVLTEWLDWSECDFCLRKEGIKFRVGKCRVKIFPVDCSSPNCTVNNLHTRDITFDENQNLESPLFANESEVAIPLVVKENVVKYGVGLSCKSLLLKTLNPDVYRITSKIPDFTLIDKCYGPCQGIPRRKGPRYKKSIILATGAHLTLVCPDSTIDSRVRWEHNKLALHPNEGEDYIPGTTEPRLYVDSFNTLYLFDVTSKEAGNYTCFVDDLRMQEVKIIVLTRSLFFTKEFTRHLKYLMLVFVFCFFAYMAGIFITCVRSRAAMHELRRTPSDSETLLKSSYEESDNSSN